MWAAVLRPVGRFLARGGKGIARGAKRFIPRRGAGSAAGAGKVAKTGEVAGAGAGVTIAAGSGKNKDQEIQEEVRAVKKEKLKLMKKGLEQTKKAAKATQRWAKSGADKPGPGWILVIFSIILTVLIFAIIVPRMSGAISFVSLVIFSIVYLALFLMAERKGQ